MRTPKDPKSYYWTHIKNMVIGDVGARRAVPLLIVIAAIILALSPAAIYAETYPTGEIYVTTTTDASEIDTSGWQDVDGVEVAGFSVCGDKLLYQGVIYNTVQIGTQCWFGENLDYDDGCSNATWVDNTDVGWCGYYNDTDYGEGLLYQWSAAMDGSTSQGAQGLCPSGWHVPTDAEWHTLEDYLWDGVTGTCDGTRTSGTAGCSPAGDVLKAAGLCQGRTPCGTTGFEGILAGYQNSVGSFLSRGMTAFFSSSTASAATLYIHSINLPVTTVTRWNNSYSKVSTHSVRCLKN